MIIDIGSELEIIILPFLIKNLQGVAMRLSDHPGYRRAHFFLSLCAFTFIFIYLFSSGCGIKTDFSQSSSSKSMTLDSDRSRSVSSPPDSPNLKPPSQQWAHAQFYKAMSFLGWEYAPPNHWENCTERTYYFPNINTMFTGVPKTGCTNWLIALLRAEGDILNRTINPFKVAWVHGGSSNRHRINHIAERHDRAVIQSAFSFTVVRNPWTRMVSGYRQKLSSEKTQGGEFRGLGQRIVMYIRGIKDQKVLQDLYPTFEEYVKFLIKKRGRIGRHFGPQTNELCLPHAMYDFIVPLEYSATLSQEVWRKINGSDTSLLGSYDKASDPRLQSSALYAKKWLSEMDPKLIEKVYKIFKGDFILMNYSNFTHPDFPLPLHSSLT